MSLLEKIAIDLGVDEQLILSGIKYVIFDGHSAYIEGVKGIKSFNSSEISLYLKKGTLVVVGENLKIKKLYRGDVALTGDIKGVKRDI